MTTRQLEKHRIIPARAGFTDTWTGSAPAGGDHPHSRGVYGVHVPRPRRRVGSSPLARGLQAVQPDFHDPPGIIPARAGFTGRPDEHPHREGDHPRSRGVYIAVLILGNTVSGSSPLARGLRRLLGRRPHLGRIIPARAGFTRALCPVLLRAADHPRSRGVYTTTHGPSRRRIGSSPLARGLHLTASQGRVGVRIIPARAGFT